MEEEQVFHLVSEICTLLKLSSVCSKTSLQYFTMFAEHNNQYNKEIMMGASIYLAAKVLEEEARIRDILNSISIVTSLYRQTKVLSSKSGNPPKYLRLYDLLGSFTTEEIEEIVKPQYSYSDYMEYKGKMIEAEQVLLRIINFDFSAAHKNKDQLKSLLLLIHHLRLSQEEAENVVRIYNDIQHVNAIEWLEGIVFCGCKLTEQNKLIGQKATEIQKKTGGSDSNEKDTQEKPTIGESNANKEVNSPLAGRDWSKIFNVKLQKLENYSVHLLRQYQKIISSPEEPLFAERKQQLAQDD